MRKPRARSRIFKKNFPARLEAIARKKALDRDTIEIWFADEARIGQKNKITRRWAKRGTRPSAPRDQRTASTYIFGAVCPKEGKGAALIMPACNTEAITCTSPRSPQPSRPLPTPSSWSIKPAGTCPRASSCRPISPSFCCRRSAQSSTRSRTSGSSCATTGSPTASSDPTTISSTIVVRHGTSSSISLGASCPTDCANGPTGSDQWDLVLGAANWSGTGARDDKNDRFASFISPGLALQGTLLKQFLDGRLDQYDIILGVEIEHLADRLSHPHRGPDVLAPLAAAHELLDRLDISVGQVRLRRAGVLPFFDYADIVTKIVHPLQCRTVIDSDARDREPVRLVCRGTEVQLPVKSPEERATIRNLEFLRLLGRHSFEDADGSARIDECLRTARRFNRRPLAARLAGVVPEVDRTSRVLSNLFETLNDLLNRGIIIFIDAMSSDKGIDREYVRLVLLYK